MSRRKSWPIRRCVLNCVQNQKPSRSTMSLNSAACTTITSITLDSSTSPKVHIHAQCSSGNPQIAEAEMDVSPSVNIPCHAGKAGFHQLLTPTSSKSCKSSESSSASSSCVPIVDPTSEATQSVQMRIKHFLMDSLPRPRSKTDPSNNALIIDNTDDDKVPVESCPQTPIKVSTGSLRGSNFNSPTAIYNRRRHHSSCSQNSSKMGASSRQHHYSGPSPHSRESSSLKSNWKPPTPVSPLCVSTVQDSQTPISPKSLEPILQGQELATTPPNRHFFPNMTNNNESVSPVFPPPPKSKKRSRSPMAGRIMNRLRSLSMSDGDPPDPIASLPDPSKLPKMEPNSSIIFTSEGIKSSKFKKLSQSAMGHSEGANDSNKTDDVLSSIIEGSSKNQLEKALCLNPDLNSDQETTMTAMAFGVRRVAENKRFLMLSKSPYRSVDDFLEGGTEFLRDQHVYGTFFQHSTCYDLLPDSAKLIVLDTNLQVGQAFRALVYNGLRAAPLWDNSLQKFVGLLTVTDFIKVLDIYHTIPEFHLDDLESQTIGQWRTLTKSTITSLITLTPEDSLYTAVSVLFWRRVHRLPVIDSRSGNLLHLLTTRRLLQYLYLKRSELPSAPWLQMTLSQILQEHHKLFPRDSSDTVTCSSDSTSCSDIVTMEIDPNSSETKLIDSTPTTSPKPTAEIKSEARNRKAYWGKSLGTFEPDLVTIGPQCSVIEALRILMKNKISAVPIVDGKGLLLGIYSKQDAMKMAMEGSYKNLNISVQESMGADFQFDMEAVTCLMTDSVCNIFEKLINNNTRRIVVVADQKSFKVVGILTGTDLIKHIILDHKPPAPQYARSYSADGSVRLRHPPSVNSSPGNGVCWCSGGRLLSASSLDQGSLHSSDGIMELEEDLFNIDVA